MIDSVTEKFQKFYPTSSSYIPYGQFHAGSLQLSGVLSGNFYAQIPNPMPWKRYFGRLDYDITPNNRLTMWDTQGDEIENGDSAVTACPSGANSATSTTTTRR